jgi:hypothetical protein
VFHGVWTIAFFCLTVIQTRAVLPNASCLLAGYLPATTVLHILVPISQNSVSAEKLYGHISGLKF